VQELLRDYHILDHSRYVSDSCTLKYLNSVGFIVNLRRKKINREELNFLLTLQLAKVLKGSFVYPDSLYFKDYVFS